MKHYSWLPIIVVVVFTYNGCSDHYIQDYSVTGMAPIPQIHINSINADTQQIFFSGSITSGIKKQILGNLLGHTKVNSHGIFEGDTVYNYIIEHPGANTFPFTGKNFRWQLPNYSVDLGIDVLMKERNYLTMRLNISESDDGPRYGFGAGYAYESINKNIGFRNEGGFTLQQLSFNALYYDYLPDFIFTSYEHQYYFHTYREDKLCLGIYTALTFFTAFSNDKLNYFIQGGLQWQKLQNYGTSSFLLGDSFRLPGGTMYISLTPGVLTSISQNGKIVGGIHIMMDFQIDDPGYHYLLFPFVQIDYSFY